LGFGRVRAGCGWGPKPEFCPNPACSGLASPRPAASARQPLTPSLGQGSGSKRRRGGFEGSGKGWQAKARARRQKRVLAAHSMAGVGAGRTARQKQARGKSGTLPRGKANAERVAERWCTAEALAARAWCRLRAEAPVRWCQAGLRRCNKR